MSYNINEKAIVAVAERMHRRYSINASDVWATLLECERNHWIHKTRFIVSAYFAAQQAQKEGE